MWWASARAWNTLPRRIEGAPGPPGGALVGNPVTLSRGPLKELGLTSRRAIVTSLFRTR